ncbi:DNA primase [Candidatus Saccharibacteria bacterium]|nr:DNA primase [Candidatus Saccharibacteria bacterium]
MEAKEEVRARLDIVDVIGDYVQLKRAGRNFKGLSPFTSERTPSFFVSPDKQIWHDFSSNRGGDVFSFVMEAEGLDFKASLEMLARKAGVDLAMYASSGDQKLAARRKRAAAALDLSAKYYQASLARNQHAAKYVLQTRKILPKTIDSFLIGYAPNADKALIQFLTKKGFQPKELSDAGLVNRFGGDLFRGRMMVALQDGNGQTIGFTGRILEDIPNAPKYLNTPQTILYDKSRHVFGLSQAKQAIRKSGYVVLVEGNLDVVSSHQAGFAMTVATAGTAMTEHHLRALSRLSTDIRLAYDNDKAGLAATERAIEIAAVVGVELKVISLPAEAKDPDELVRQDPKSWQQAIEAAQPAIEWLIDHYAENLDITSASGKRQFTSSMLGLTAKIQDPVEREHYETKVAARIGVSLETIHSKIDQMADQERARPKRKVKTSHQIASESTYYDDLLAVAIIDPACRSMLTQSLAGSLPRPEQQRLYDYLLHNEDASLTNIPKNLQDIDTYVKIVILRAETRYAPWSDQDRYQETARLIRHIEYENKKNKRDTLIDQLREAELSGEDQAAHQLREQLNVVIKEIARGKR